MLVLYKKQKKKILVTLKNAEKFFWERKFIVFDREISFKSMSHAFSRALQIQEIYMSHSVTCPWYDKAAINVSVPISSRYDWL